MQLTKHWAAQLDDYVIDLAWSADGTMLAAASAAGPISVFAAKDGSRTPTLPGHTDGTNAISWSPTGATLASGGQDGTVKLWDAVSAQHTATAELSANWIDHVSWRPVAKSNLILAAASGRDLVFLNADASVRHKFKPAPKTISAVVWHPGGGALAAGYFGGVCIWDADDCIAQKEFAYGNGIQTLAWSPDGKWLVSGNQDPSVHLWIAEDGTELHMSGYEGKVKHLSFDRTSRWLATSGGRDSCVWDCSGDGPEGREPAMLPHEAPVCGVRFQHAHGLLASASQDGVVQLWSPERPNPLRATVRMPSTATKLAWSPDDQHLAIGSEKGAVYVLKCDA